MDYLRSLADIVKKLEEKSHRCIFFNFINSCLSSKLASSFMLLLHQSYLSYMSILYGLFAQFLHATYLFSVVSVFFPYKSSPLLTVDPILRFQHCGLTHTSENFCCGLFIGLLPSKHDILFMRSPLVATASEPNNTILCQFAQNYIEWVLPSGKWM